MGVLAETHLFYSSLVLFAMSCLTLVLCIFFRLKRHRINSLSKNVSANVFDKTFNIFNPYPEHRKIIHNFLRTLGVMINFAAMYVAFFMFKIIQFRILLSLVILLVCLHLMLLDFAAEIYQTYKIFIKAVHSKAGWGVGDLEVFQKLKSIMPKLSNYYLALSILFLTFAATLGYIWSSLLWLFFLPIGPIFEVSELTGVIGFLVAGLLYSAIVLIILILAWKIKSKVLSYIVGS